MLILKLYYKHMLTPLMWYSRIAFEFCIFLTEWEYDYYFMYR